MTRDDIRKLLGGYATDTLTAEEQQALFAAAMEDQDLFDALAREQTLRDLLREPAAKEQLLGALREADRAAASAAAVPWYRRYAFGLGAAAACMAALTAVLVLRPAHGPQQLATLGSVMRDEAPVAPEPRQPAAKAAPAGEPAEPAAGPVHAIPRLAKPRDTKNAPTPLPGPGPQAETVVIAPKVPPPVPAAAQAPPPAPVTVANGSVAGNPRQTADAVTGTPPAVQAFAAGSMGTQISAPVTGGFVPLQGQQGQQGSQQQVAVTAEQPRALFRAEMLGEGARGGRGGGGGANVPISAISTILRKQDDGSFIETGAGDLHSGDTIRLRFTPNADGYLSVVESAPGPPLLKPVINARVERTKPFETEPFQANQPGRKEYTVVLSHDRQVRVDESTAIGAISGNLSGARVRAASSTNSPVAPPPPVKIILEFK